MSYTHEHKVSIIKSTKVTEVLATCAFGFAFISFLSTANGLNEFAFEGTPWRGYLLSFSIQAVLLVLNLNLPKFLDELNKTIFYKCVIAIFYMILLLASSFFSFVFISNLAYMKTYHVDAQSISEKGTMEEIIKARSSVINEEENLLLNIREEINKLQENQTVPLFQKLIFDYAPKVLLAPDDLAEQDLNHDKVTITHADMQTNYGIKARHNELLILKNDMEKSFNELTMIDKTLYDLSGKKVREKKKEILDITGRVSQLHAIIYDYQGAIEEIQKKIKSNENFISLEQTTGWQAYQANLENEYYTKQIAEFAPFLSLISSNSTTGFLKQWNDILTEIEQYQSALLLLDNVRVELAEKGIDDEDYKKKRQELTATIEYLSKNQDSSTTTWSLQDFIDNYSKYENLYMMVLELDTIANDISSIKFVIDPTLDEIQSKSDALIKGGITTNENELAKQLRADKENEWLNSWNTQINTLHITLLNIPSYIDYDIIGGANNLTDLYRKNFSEISAVEKAMNQLLGEYPGKAVFALLFAFFMDLSSLVVGIIIYLRSTNRDDSVTTMPKHEAFSYY